MTPQGGEEYEYAKELVHEEVQEVLHNGSTPEQPSVPVEVRVLHYYLLEQGTSSERGPYSHTRQWKPSGFWRGNKEFGTLLSAVRSEIADSSVDFSHVIDRRSGFQDQRTKKSQLNDLAKSVLYLDKHSPKWRKRAQVWEDGGWFKAAWQKTRSLVSTKLGREKREP